MSSLRICLIASSRFPIRQPFAGGLEAHTHSLARCLHARGHHVSLFAAPGSDPVLRATELGVELFQSSRAARADTAAPPERWMREHHAYLGLMLSLAGAGRRRFDVVHNNSLHHLPVAMASMLAIPMVTTLHTPPVPWLESALAFAPEHSVFVAVSEFVASAWAGSTLSETIYNGIDTDQWTPGVGKGPAVWSGRLVPEKAPHLAIDACRTAGIPLVLAGPRLDVRYFDEEVRPRLGDDAQYLGHLTHEDLCATVGRARVAVVTPMWDEPYGLVAAEARACGTPVAAFARGGLPEIVDDSVGALARPGDVDDLARAITEAGRRDRRLARRAAEERCSMWAMTDKYERLYSRMAPRIAA
jgi:glycosyltransferase involved in cell wall biosynthesis